jgi:hypothetical protein
VGLPIRHADPRGPARQLTRELSEPRTVEVPHPPPDHASPPSEHSPRFSHSPSAALPEPAKPLPSRHSRPVAIRVPLIAVRVGTLPEQWPGITQSPSWVDPPFYETTQHVRPRAAPRDRFLPHRHVGERNERHDEPPCRWHFPLVRLHGIEGIGGVEPSGHASRDEITDAQPGPGDPRWDYLTDSGLDGTVESPVETGETGGTDR